MAENILFLTELLGMNVHDVRGRRIGRVKDAGLVPTTDPVRVDHFLVGGGEWTWLTVRHDQVATITLDGIFLLDEHLTPYHEDQYLLRMVRDLLDQQIIDVHGRKVVRVNDVTFEVRKEGGRDALWILEVDVGVRSILRRLFQGILTPRLIRRMQQPIHPHSIRWEFCNIVEPDPQRRVRLNISHKGLETLHPADLADIVEELSPDAREAIFETLDSEVAADTLSEVEPRVKASILESLETERAADIVEDMAPDAAADALADIEPQTSERILEGMEAEEKIEVEELLEFDEDSAGGMMNTEFIVLPDSLAVAGAAEALRQTPDLADVLNTVFVQNAAGSLTGAIPVARLFLAPGDTPLIDLASAPSAAIRADEHRDRVTEMFDKYNLLTLPVVDAANRLLGIITADDVISLLRRE
jgi:sporulation protein YlmC with PRC-barrel domain